MSTPCPFLHAPGTNNCVHATTSLLGLFLCFKCPPFLTFQSLLCHQHSQCIHTIFTYALPGSLPKTGSVSPPVHVRGFGLTVWLLGVSRGILCYQPRPFSVVSQISLVFLIYYLGLYCLVEDSFCLQSCSSQHQRRIPAIWFPNQQ